MQHAEGGSLKFLLEIMMGGTERGYMNRASTEYGSGLERLKTSPRAYRQSASHPRARFNLIYTLYTHYACHTTPGSVYGAMTK